MATTGLLALIDDISTVLDDVAVLSKVAAKKTAGVLGDDLALNAEQVTGVRAERELPVVWAVCKGSFINKLILVPSALVISALLPGLITPLLMLGGLYLCYEGVEKVLHKFLHSKEENEQAHKEKLERLVNSSSDLVALEKDKIKGAIRTDFILSAEIIVIALGTVSQSTLLTQALVVCTIAIFVTVGVYSLVAGIVKIDDLGLHLLHSEKSGPLRKKVGKSLLLFAPKLMKLLSVLGTIAMFLVGGGIIVHALPFLHHIMHDVKHAVEQFGMIVKFLAEPLVSGVVGFIAGSIVLSLVKVVSKLRAKPNAVS